MYFVSYSTQKPKLYKPEDGLCVFGCSQSNETLSKVASALISDWMKNVYSGFTLASLAAMDEERLKTVAWFKCRLLFALTRHKPEALARGCGEGTRDKTVTGPRMDHRAKGRSTRS